MHFSLNQLAGAIFNCCADPNANGIKRYVRRRRVNEPIDPLTLDAEK
jgi:hypothetical protein